MQRLRKNKTELYLCLTRGLYIHIMICASRAGGMVDARDLKSRGRKVRAGSSPAPGTMAQALDIAGWSRPVARRAHNPKVAGSNPAPATNLSGGVAQMARACGSYPQCQWFESTHRHHCILAGRKGGDIPAYAVCAS